MCISTHPAVEVEEVDVGAIAAMRQELLDMHNKYEETMATLNRITQYSMYLASCSLKATETCSNLKTRFEEFVPQSLHRQLLLEDRIQRVETQFKSHNCLNVRRVTLLSHCSRLTPLSFVVKRSQLQLPSLQMAPHPTARSAYLHEM